MALSGVSFLPIDAPTDRPLTVLPSPPITTVLGVALGDHASEPAIYAVRQTPVCIRPADPMFGQPAVFETHFNVLGATHFPPDTSYPTIATRINILAKRLHDRDSRGDYHVVADASNVGFPVIGAIRDTIIPQCHVTAVTITTGDRADASLLWRTESTVGLAWLVSRLQVILQTNRITIPTSAATASLLDRLRDYRLDSDRGPDAVRALALCCSADYGAVRYDISPDALPSPRL